MDTQKNPEKGEDLQNNRPRRLIHKYQIMIKLPDGRLDVMRAWYEEQQLFLEYPPGEIHPSEKILEEVYLNSIEALREYYSQAAETGVDYLEMVCCNRYDPEQVRKYARYNLLRLDEKVAHFRKIVSRVRKSTP
jgi:hypothetical protein